MIRRQFQVYPFLLNQISRGFVQFDGVFDGIDAGFNAIAQTFAAKCMARNLFLMPVGLIDDCFHFFLRECRITE